MTFPPLPEGIRFATISDLHRLSIVSTAGFYHSPVFHYLRPRYKDYLQDTIASYRSGCREDILDPNAVVIVAEQSFKENESEAVFEQLKNVYPSLHEQVPMCSSETGKVIVGIATLSLHTVPKLSGRFLPPDGIPCPLSPEEILKRLTVLTGPKMEAVCHDLQDLGRDKCLEAGKRFFEIQEKAKEEWFQGHMEVTSIVVHPAYWREGNGKKMSEWFIKLATHYGMPVCVSAAPMGAELAAHVGFKKGTAIDIAGYKEHDDAIQLWLGLRKMTGQTLEEKDVSFEFTPAFGPVYTPAHFNSGVFTLDIVNSDSIPKLLVSYCCQRRCT